MLVKLDIDEGIYEAAFPQVSGKLYDLVGWHVRELIRWEVEGPVYEVLRESLVKEE